MKRLLFGLAIFLGLQRECGSASGALRRSTRNHHHDDFRPLEATLRAKESPSASATSTASKRSLQENTNGKAYALLDSEEIYNWMVDLPGRYPDFVRLTTAQEAYGLPAAGKTTDCPYDGNANGCLIHIVTVQDFVIHPEGSDSSKRLPEVLLTGTLHGNERVGPTAVVEALELMLEVALCESYQNDNLSKRFCQSDLEARGIDAEHRRWLARLVTTRRIVALPTANAVGYYRNEREEDGIDANRDFPYDILDPTQCMQTIAARALNEVVREHMFQMALVYHAGVTVLGYEWGAVSWNRVAAPDDISQRHISEAHSSFGGSWPGENAYPYGPMYATVYTVRGGMEDWAYAASWDPDRVIQCEPTSYSGYPASKTMYTNSSHRLFNMLVETSDTKAPQYDLGSSGDLFDPDSPGNGHVPRNIRLSLIATDIVEPYVHITDIGGTSVYDEIIPLRQPQDSQACRENPVLEIDTGTNSEPVVVSWKIGGSLQVDETALWLGRWDDLPTSTLKCFSQPSRADIETLRKSSVLLNSSNGLGDIAFTGEGRSFVATIDPSTLSPGGEFFILASARVDQSWSHPPEGVQPQVPPQTHLANVRTDPSWYHESERNIVQGRLDWFSVPVTIAVAVSEKVMDNPTESPFTEAPSGVPTGISTGVPTGQKVSTVHPSSSSSLSEAPSDSPTDAPSNSPTDLPTLVPSPTPSLVPSQAPVGSENVFRSPMTEQRTNSTAPFSEEIDIVLWGLEMLLNSTQQESFEEAVETILSKQDETVMVDIMHQQLLVRKPSRHLQQEDALQSFNVQIITLISSWMDETPGLTAVKSIRQSNAIFLDELVSQDTDVFGSVEEVQAYTSSPETSSPPSTTTPPVTIITQAPTISFVPSQQPTPELFKASSTSDSINISVLIVPIAVFLVITVGATIYFKRRLTQPSNFTDQAEQFVDTNNYNDGSLHSAGQESTEDGFWDEAVAKSSP